MKCLSNEEVKMPHIRLTFGMVIMFLIGCFSGATITVIKTHKPPEIITKEITVHDTTYIVKPNEVTPIADAAIKVLLIDYYKSGWMDASNGLIDLYNDDNLSDEFVGKLKHKDWRKMENQVNSK